MAASVNFFNAGSNAITISVNNGAPFSVAGAGAPTWTPQTPASNPGFTPGPPSPGTLGVGTNRVSVAVQGSSPFMIQIGLAPNINWMSVQIYLFPGYDGCPWLVLNNGQLIAQGSS